MLHHKQQEEQLPSKVALEPTPQLNWDQNEDLSLDKLEECQGRSRRLHIHEPTHNISIQIWALHYKNETSHESEIDQSSLASVDSKVRQLHFNGDQWWLAAIPMRYTAFTDATGLRTNHHTGQPTSHNPYTFAIVRKSTSSLNMSYKSPRSNFVHSTMTLKHQ